MKNDFDFVKGTMLGGVLGGLIGLLAAPKSGMKLCEDIASTCCDINKKSQCLLKDIKNKGQKWMHMPEEKDESVIGNGELVVAGLVAAALATGAYLLLSSSSTEELKEDLGDKYDEMKQKITNFFSDLTNEESLKKSDEWKDIFSSLAENLSKNLTDKKLFQSKVKDLADWANLGIRFYQQILRKK